MEDDDDSEMADYASGTDLSDDVESIVDPHFDAKARPQHRGPQQGSTVEIRSRRSFAGASREVPFKLKLVFPLSDPE